MPRAVCEFCKKQTNKTEVSLVLTSHNNLEDCELCSECIKIINEVDVENEVDTVKKLIAKGERKKW